MNRRRHGLDCPLHRRAGHPQQGPYLLCRLVAAMDHRKGEYVPPLQDNVQLILEWVQQRWPWVNVLWRWEWIGIKHKLVAVVMLALSVLFNQVSGL